MTAQEGPFSSALRQLFEPCQRLLGCGLRWKDADPVLRKAMPEDLVAHLHPYCLAVKESDPKRAARCRRHCVIEGWQWQQHRKPARRSTCHAGCMEYREPVCLDDNIMGTLIIGPFTAAADGNSSLPAEPSCLDEVVALLTQAIQLLKQQRQIERNEFMHASPHPALQRLSKFMQHYKHGQQASELAEACDISVSRLQHLCSQHLQQSLGNICQQALLRRIQQALSSTTDHIGAIARDAGFEDQRYFSTWFKRLTGQTPQQWRRSELERV